MAWHVGKVAISGGTGYSPGLMVMVIWLDTDGIVDENGQVVDIGVDGEIQLKSPTLLCGYRKQDELFKTIITEDGFLKTGDMGVMRSDGGFIIKGRVADVMRFKVFAKVLYPTPVEEALSSHPSIKDIQVISGNRNDWMGDEVTYCIILMEEAEEIAEEEIITYTKDHGLTEQYNPCRIIYFNVFPRTANFRKVSKKLIREQVADMIKKDPLIGATQTLRNRAEKMGVDLSA